MAAGPETLKVFREHLAFQTIGPDKLNQLRHIYFFGDVNGIMEQMKRHRALIAPKFQTVLKYLHTELEGKGIADWTKPKGGYCLLYTSEFCSSYKVT